MAPQPARATRDPQDGHPYNATAVDLLRLLVEELERLVPVVGASTLRLTLAGHQNVVLRITQVEKEICELRRYLELDGD